MWSPTATQRWLHTLCKGPPHAILLYLSEQQIGIIRPSFVVRKKLSKEDYSDQASHQLCTEDSMGQMLQCI